jgi:hypothetical protein
MSEPNLDARGHARVGSQNTVTYPASTQQNGGVNLGPEYNNMNTSNISNNIDYDDDDYSNTNDNTLISPDNQQQQQVEIPEAPDTPRLHQSKPSESFSVMNATSPGKDSFIKVKVFHEDDLIAVRVPLSVSFDALSQKIVERLGLNEVALLHKDESTGEFDQLTSNEDLARALDGKAKLVLYAK